MCFFQEGHHVSLHSPEEENAKTQAVTSQTINEVRFFTNEKPEFPFNFPWSLDLLKPHWGMPNPLVGWGHFPHLLTSAAPKSNVFLYNVVLSMCGIPYREIDDIARFITFKPHYWQETEEWNGHVPVNIHDIPFGYKLLLWASHKAMSCSQHNWSMPQWSRIDDWTVPNGFAVNEIYYCSHCSLSPNDSCQRPLWSGWTCHI